MTSKTALITGVTGQDGSYLSELLLEKGYSVCGLIRRTSSMNRDRIDHLRDNPNFTRVYGDLSDASSITSAINNQLPDEVYNLAAQSHVKISFDVPEYTGDVDGLGVTRLLDAVKKAQDRTGKQIKFYQASTSELFGKAKTSPQNELTPFHPRSPYGCAKLYAYWMVRNYRESYGLFATNGILFNHESKRRPENFVTRKITSDVAKIKFGKLDCLTLGNLDAYRDWGHAADYVEAMHLMLQQDQPDDYVVATGEQHTVREFLEAAFSFAEIPVESNGKRGLAEEYTRVDNGETVVKIDPAFFRPAEVDTLLGDASKIRALGWKPKHTFLNLVSEMVDNDISLHGVM